MSTRTLSVPEISCVTCKTAIEGALRPLAGVRDMQVDVTAKRVGIEFDESHIDVDQLIAAIERQGFQVDTENR